MRMRDWEICQADLTGGKGGGSVKKAKGKSKHILIPKWVEEKKERDPRQQLSAEDGASK